MKIFYSCFGGTHSSVVAAWIHTGRLPKERIPRYSEIVSLPYYDRITQDQVGVPCYIGTDELGHEVYVIGLGKQKKIVLNAFQDVLEIFNIPPSEVMVVNSSKYLNFFTRIGGFISRCLGLVTLGRPLTVWGIWLRYRGFVKMVEEVKKAVRSKKTPVVF